MRVQSWAPGHATLFFSVPETFEEPIQRGSLGGGFNFTSGVLTTVEQNDIDQILWNHQQISGEVTLTALRKFREITGIDIPVCINHFSELDIGYGLSTSGAGTLGTVYSLDKLFNTKISNLQLHQIAHKADVLNHTGLGSVMGQITGGIELRTEIGGPGIGKTIRYTSEETIVILMMGKLKTSDVLQSPEQMETVTSAGLLAVNKAKKITKNYVSEFLKIGREFTLSCGLATQRVMETLDKLERIGETQASMAMIGETIIIKPVDTDAVVEFAQKYNLKTIVTEITNKNPQLIQLNS